MLQVQKSIGRVPQQLADRPILRNELGPFWELFVQLKNASGGPIRFVDIEAYGSIYGKLSAFEVDITRALDELHGRESG